MDTKLVGQCITASTKVNGAIRQWNAAVRSGSDSERDSAARRLGTTAGDLRSSASSSTSDGFKTRARKVADEMEEMKKDQDAGKSVSSTGLNSAHRDLRTWCSDQIKP